MLEIEAKMRLADLPALERRLASLDAQRLPDLLEVNTFFDTPEGALKASDQGLRVRLSQRTDSGESTVTITHKGPRAHGRLKSRVETEVNVADARRAANLLNALGYLRVLGFEKLRRHWRVDGCEVCIDTLPHLGDFVEIEGDSDQRVLDVRERLGLGDLPLIRASYISLLIDYLAENHIREDFVRLADQKT